MLYWAKKKRMEDIQQQLAALRQRIARVDRKYANAAAPSAAARSAPDGKFIEELLSGEVVHHAFRPALRNRASLGIAPPPRQRLHFRSRRAAR